MTTESKPVAGLDGPTELRRRLREIEAEAERLRAMLGDERPGGLDRPAHGLQPGLSPANLYKELAEILDISADAIISTDAHGMMRRFNRGAEQIFGYRASEVIGRPIEILMPQRFRARHKSHLGKFGHGPGESRLMNERGELWGLRKDGTEFPCEASIAKLHSGGNRQFIAILRDVSERIEAEAAIRKSEALLAALIDNLPAAIHIKDLDGRYLRVNKEYERQFSLSAETVLGRTIREFFPSRTAVEAEAHDSLVLETLTPQEREIPFFGANGKVRHLAVKSPLLDEAGNPTAILCVETDITERRAAEIALRESEAHLRQAQSLARVGAFTWNEAGDRLEYCSDELVAMLGLDAKRVLEISSSWATMLDTVHPEDRDAYSAAILDARSMAKPYVVEFRYLHPDGRVLHLREIGEPIFDGRGAMTHCFGTIQDITELRRTELALRETLRAGELIRRIATAANGAATAGEAMSVCLEAICRHGNWDVADIFLTADDGSGDMIPADRWWTRKRGDFAVLRKATRGIRFVPGQGLPGRVAGSGSPAWIVDLEADPDFLRARTKEELGVTTGFAFPVLVGSEIAAVLEFFSRDRRELDHDLMDVAVQAGTLLGRVVERERAARALRESEEKLRRAQKMEAVGKLTGGVAHDFNNLLAVVIGNAEILRDRLGGDDPAVEGIARAAQRGADLTQRLLSFSRQQPLRPTPVDMAELADVMSAMLSRTIKASITIGTDIPSGLWPALVDASELEAAVLNLALNAAHAMPKGGKLSISARNVTMDGKAAALHDDAKAGDYVELSVADNGMGMKRDVLARALEPFFTTKEVGEGSGLGLSMVYGFAAQSGGFLKIESRWRQGTTVRLYLPRAGAREPARQTSIPPCKPNVTECTIMVVEDDPDVRRLTVALLKSLGYTVMEAEDGESALPILRRSKQIDLLLSDVVLPGGMSGPDIAEHALKKRPDLRVMFMSGYAEDILRREREGERRRVDADVLHKPFTKADLALRVQKILEGNSGEAGHA